VKLDRGDDILAWHSKCVIGNRTRKVEAGPGEWWLAMLTQSTLRIAWRAPEKGDTGKTHTQKREGGKTASGVHVDHDATSSDATPSSKSLYFVETNFIHVASLTTVRYSFEKSMVIFSSQKKQVVIYLNPNPN